MVPRIFLHHRPSLRWVSGKVAAVVMTTGAECSGTLRAGRLSVELKVGRLSSPESGCQCDRADAPGRAVGSFVQANGCQRINRGCRNNQESRQMWETKA